jgi:hypothetical protein
MPTEKPTTTIRRLPPGKDSKEQLFEIQTVQSQVHTETVSLSDLDDKIARLKRSKEQQAEAVARQIQLLENKKRELLAAPDAAKEDK